MAKQLVQVTRVSQLTGKERTARILLDPADYQSWKDGTLIQRAMPYLSDAEREFIMTGVTQDEWDRYMQPVQNDTAAR